MHTESDQKTTIEILARLSSGGMGEVLLARQVGWAGFEKLVAIKMIRGDLVHSDNVRKMFLDEARLVARLNHPCIAQVYDFGEMEGSLFLAMEYVPGIGLNKLIKRGTPVEPMVAAQLAMEVCSGLHAAHELKDHEGKLLGVVHRDVTPQNLILGFDGRVKILDFGIAWMRDREAPETEFGVVKGKPSYMAPEQIKNLRVDRRADVYGVSVVLHELLTGKRLFPDDSIVKTARAIESGNIVPPSATVSNVPQALDDIVLKGLEREPSARFQTAKEMATALEELLHEKPGMGLSEFVDSHLDEDRQRHWNRLHSLIEDNEIAIEEVDEDEAPTIITRSTRFGPSEEEAQTVFSHFQSKNFEVVLREDRADHPEHPPVGALEDSQGSVPGLRPKGPKIAAMVLVLLIIAGLSAILTSRLFFD